MLVAAHLLQEHGRSKALRVGRVGRRADDVLGLLIDGAPHDAVRALAERTMSCRGVPVGDIGREEGARTFCAPTEGCAVSAATKKTI